MGGHDGSADHGMDHGGGADLNHSGFDHGIDIGHDVDLSHGGDLAHGADLSHGADLAHGTELGHDVGTQHDADTADSPSPFNPLVIASAITAFGAFGLISMKGFGMNGLMSTIVALGFAGAIGAAIFFGIVKFMYGSQSNTVFSLDDLIDTEAEVLTPVPEKGLGEIAYYFNGTRSTMSARSIDGKGIGRGTAVVIREIAANAAGVQRKLTLDDIEITHEQFNETNRETPRSDAENNKI